MSTTAGASARIPLHDEIRFVAGGVHYAGIIHAVDLEAGPRGGPVGMEIHVLITEQPRPTCGARGPGEVRRCELPERHAGRHEMTLTESWGSAE